MFSETKLKTGTVPFLFSVKKVKGCVYVKVHERLWCSVSVLVGAVLAVFSFVPRFWRTGILLAVFAIWGLWVFKVALLPRIVWRLGLWDSFRGRKPSRRRDCNSSQREHQAEDTLVKHVNYRISTYLHSAFPDASWEWVTKDPASLITHGGQGRILLHGVPDYNYAEVDLRRSGRIECRLVRVDPFPSGAIEQKEARPKEDEQFNPQVWFELQGRQVLEDLVADLDSRGHHSLTMNEDGSITVEDDVGGKAFPAFSSFPRKVHWPQMVRVLEGAGYAADVDGDGIRITL